MNIIKFLASACVVAGVVVSGTAYAAPTVSITSPASNATFVAPASITINADAVSSDSTIAKVDFYNGASLLATSTATPFSFTWTNVPVGTYTVTALATDNIGAATTSDSVTVNVNENGPLSVRITAPANNAVFVAPATINFNADIGGAVVGGVSFFRGDNSSPSYVSTQSPHTYTWTNVAAGTYSVRAQVVGINGSNGPAASDTLNVYVVDTLNQPITVNLTSPVNSAVFTTGSRVDIRADVSGNINKVEFFGGGTLLATKTSPPYQYYWNEYKTFNPDGFKLGVNSITVKATDVTGASITSAVTNINVVQGNPLSIDFNEPVVTPITTFVEGSDITLGAVVPDAGGNSRIREVSFSYRVFDSFNGVFKDLYFGFVSIPPYSYVWKNVPAGDYQVSAFVSDYGDGYARSLPKLISVKSNPDIIDTSFKMQGYAFIDKAVYPTTQKLSPSIVVVSKVKPQRAQIYANSTLLCETTNGAEMSQIFACDDVLFAAGTYTISAKVISAIGTVISSTAGTIIVQTTPSIRADITTPADADKFWPGHLDIVGSLTLPLDATFKLYGYFYDCSGTYFAEIPVTIVNQGFTVSYDWNPADSSKQPVCLRASALAADGTSAQTTRKVGYFSPSVAFVNKPTTIYASTAEFEVAAAIPPSTPRVEINGVVATLSGTTYKATVPLVVGTNTVTAIAYNGATEVARTSYYPTYVASVDRNLTANITRPQYSEIAAASAYFVTEMTTANVYGKVTGVVATTVLIRDAQGSTRIAAIQPDGTYNESITAYSGYNEIFVTAYGPGGALATVATSFVNFTADDKPVIVITSPTSCSVVSTLPAAFSVVASAFTSDQTNLSPNYYTATFKANTVSIGSASKAIKSFDNNMTFAWTGVQNGTFQLTASLNNYASTASTPVKVTVSGAVIPPTVSLIAPVNNTTVGSPLTLTLNAQNVVGTIATIEFLDGANHIIGYNINAASNNYTLNYVWEDASSGVHTLTARVTNSDGVTITSAPVTITVRAAPTVNLSAAGAFYLSPGSVDLLIGAATGEPGATINRIEIYNSVVIGNNLGMPALITTLTTAPYRYRLTNLAIGTYRIAARAIDSLGNSRDSAPFEIRVGAALGFGTTLPPGLNGGTINGNTLSFATTINVPPNTAVTVNGVTATLSRDGHVVANGLVLNPGTNTITVSITPSSGPVLKQAITLTRAPSPPSFDLSVIPLEGIAPVVSLMEVKNPGRTPFGTVLLSCHNPTGDAALAESQSSTLAGALECRYSKPGLYQPWAAIKDAGGTLIWTDTKFVVVDDPLDSISVVRYVHASMLDQLKAGNPNSALSQFAGNAKTKYSDIFTALGANLSTAATQMGEVGTMTVSGGAADVTVIRNVNGVKKAFNIHLLKGEDGVWRIESM